MTKIQLLFFSFLILSFVSIAQTPNLNHSFKNYYSKSLHHLDSNFHTAIQPYNPFDVQHLIDTCFQNVIKEKDGFIGRKLFNEHLINIEGADYQVNINPIFDLSFGQDSDRDNVNMWRNGRGFQVMGRLGNQFRFYSDFLENQAQFPGYVQNYINERGVVPGQGIPKNFKRKGAKDFAYVSSFINFKTKKFFNFELGYGKHFFGDGYRSMLLSDNAFNYPYLKINTTFWRVKYTNLFTQMLDVRSRNQHGLYLKKYVTSHYLSVNIGKRLNVGLFESIIYQDSSGTRGYDLNYLNPIIFYRPVEFALGSGGGNVLIGMNLKFQLSNKQFLYGQLALDEFKIDEIREADGWWANKFGIQIGVKSFDTFIPNLTLQAEVNTARPYMYSHTTSLQNYGHYNQPLAHTLGANFRESIMIIHYYKKRIFGELKLMFAEQGFDSNNQNWGGDIYLDNSTREMDFGNETLQGVEAKTFLADFKVGYLINPKSNLRFELGITYRNLQPEIEVDNLQNRTTNYFYFGIVNRLHNTYHDF